MSELHGSLLFHLNLEYSSIEVEDRPRVVERCYRPLLELCERLEWLVLALEAPAHTLELAADIDPGWLARLRELCDAGRVELVGSGDTQLVGPLVPAAVNRWNQRLGQEGYERLLGRRPTSALVNEMAWSQGLVDAYLDAGYDTLVMEWNNPRRRHPEWEDEWRHGLVWTASPGGRRIALAWADTVAFQKLQRVVGGDLELDEYRAWVGSRAGTRPRHLGLYASDAEVFDFRPGRYRTEPPARAGEWRRLADVLRALHADGVRFTTPARLRADTRFAPRAEVRLTSAADPVPVKKQPKYNLLRWALSGRDDLGLNAACFAEAARLAAEGGTERQWRALCRQWGSDRRTHLTERRWSALAPARADVRRDASAARSGPPLTRARVQRVGPRLAVETDGVRLVLCLRRGLAIESLAFPRAADLPLAGTLPHGHFDDVEWAADFYSGHTVVEVPAQRRVTDLEPVEPEVHREETRVVVVAQVPTPFGALPKRVTVERERVEIACDLSAWGERPLGSVRTGFVTLREEVLGERLFVRCASGGDVEELPLEEPCDHGASVSPLVSASAAFGASDGRLALHDGRTGLALAWPMAEAPALPLLAFRRIGGRRFVRVAFSLGEIDETLRPGAPLRDFRLSITPWSPDA